MLYALLAVQAKRFTQGKYGAGGLVKIICYVIKKVNALLLEPSLKPTRNYNELLPEFKIF